MRAENFCARPARKEQRRTRSRQARILEPLDKENVPKNPNDFKFRLKRLVDDLQVEIYQRGEQLF